MTCILDAIAGEKENLKNYALQIGEKCIGTAIGGAILAGITTVLEISIIAANPIGAAALCGTLALSEYLNNKCVTFIHIKLSSIENDEVRRSLQSLVSEIATGVKMVFWILAATFAASYMGVPVVAGVFIFIGAHIALKGLLALKSWCNTRKPDPEVEYMIHNPNSINTNVQTTNTQYDSRNDQSDLPEQVSYIRSNQQYDQQSFYQGSQQGMGSYNPQYQDV